MKEPYILSEHMAQKDVFSAVNGIEVHAVERDRAVIRLTITEKSKNLLGIVHGGALYTMADCAAMPACWQEWSLRATRRPTSSLPITWRLTPLPPTPTDGSM